MTRLFVDSNVLLYAYGGRHLLRDACRGLVERATDHQITLHVSVEAIQEFLHHRMRMDPREAAVDATRTMYDLCVRHPFDDSVLRRAMDLAAVTSLRGRDAVHAATALEHGFGAIVSGDPDFNEIPGLRRLDPTAL
ncbi:MAG TPA: type II toxin-antitoxin system VapC family toxin [Nocardioidaceae bacterium]|nr:type II toxin-antitoxin system VapC family toxin [Nocardioidaceae bacterium]